ncbi:RNA-guided endonuclease IscB [Nonomuraea sp. 3N208]|uniref:RNA-guided endonuclease IscB n=1 Tax=Nonomuraea sp. 3N208 TaxID=3457421 RepID=UPI003FD669ED
MFVLASDGTPLDPCHPARARKLLKVGRAVVARHTPFVIRLKDRTTEQSEVEGVEVSIDPGSRHTGISVFRAHDGTSYGLYAIQLDHRGCKIRNKLAARAAYRRGRRSRNLRYRAPRFANRRRPEGWLAPSLRHRVDTTMAWVVRLRRLAPVRAIQVETVRFDPHALAAGKPLAGTESQHGTLHGYEAREYLLEKWGRTCTYCAAGDTPLTIDHIQPRSRGGSDRISNLCLVCVPCNQAKNSMPVTEFLAGRPAVLTRVLAQVKAPLRDAASVNSTRLRMPRTKQIHGYQTGDLVRATVPKGKHAGTHTGRVAVRTSGSHTVQACTGLITTSHKHLRLLQRADGYAYTIIKEQHPCVP